MKTLFVVTALAAFGFVPIVDAQQLNIDKKVSAEAAGAQLPPVSCGVIPSGTSFVERTSAGLLDGFVYEANGRCVIDSPTWGRGGRWDFSLDRIDSRYPLYDHEGWSDYDGGYGARAPYRVRGEHADVAAILTFHFN